MRINSARLVRQLQLRNCARWLVWALRQLQLGDASTKRLKLRLAPRTRADGGVDLQDVDHEGWGVSDTCVPRTHVHGMEMTCGWYTDGM